MIWQFLSWYLIMQLMTLVALPLGTTLFVNLPDRGYAFLKSLGVLLVGFLFWLGYSYGILRNESGGAWLAVVLVGVFSATVGRGFFAQLRRPGERPLRWQTVLMVEVLFLAAFAFWAYVRAHDPAVDHTEEPMDLMFMNSIWVSPTFPPHDAWLSGYAISYYYFGYWLLTTLGRLAGQPPEIAYTLGQASWYGLLWIGCFGIVYNLLAYRNGHGASAFLGGLLGGTTVAFAANPQGFFEWLHANGYNITALARWFNVTNFPALAGPDVGQTGNWYVSFDWWWWRASRVISDRWLTGDHMEVIDEFPIFSYILGDNHPHVMAMPIAILLVALALNLFLSKRRIALPIAIDTLQINSEAVSSPVTETTGTEQETTEGPAEERTVPTHAESTSWLPALLRSPATLREFIQTIVPLGGAGLLTVTVVLGSLIFLNTWDLPAYWLLLALSLTVLVWRNLGNLPLLSNFHRWQQTLIPVVLVAIGLLIGSWLLYYPYLLTAQSQAGGIVPNLFNPTRLPQFLLMFGFAIFGMLGLLGLSWQRIQHQMGEKQVGEKDGSRPAALGVIGTLVLGLPILFLLLSTLATTTAGGGQRLAGNMPLPEGSSNYIPYIAARWGANFWTFLLVGGLVTLCAWLALRYLETLPALGTPATPAAVRGDETNLFVLLLALIGLLLLFAPEFVYLRDNFGTRMNTVFKFYYQAWLLLGLSSSYLIVTAIRQFFRADSGATAGVNTLPASRTTAQINSGLRVGTFACAILSLLIVGTGLFYPVMAVYSKAGGFASDNPTFNAVAYLAQYSPNEWAAVEWIRNNTPGDAIVLESKGASYRSNYNRISTITGRQTLMGWDGHESQWRGEAFGEMAQGRDQALETIYRGGTPDQIRRTLDEWQIDYVYIGPIERTNYGLPPQAERNLTEAMDLVFEAGDVRIYQRRQ